jgi:DNA primase
LAKTAIQESQSIMLMEGYMDVLMAHQFGFKNAVGTMGTAVTDEHIQKLRRFTDTVYLALDSDDAGQKAIERSVALLKKHHLRVFICRFQDKDPADFLMSKGAAAFSACVQNAESSIVYYLRLAEKKYGTQTIEARAKIIQELVPHLLSESDTMVRQHYLESIAAELNVDRSYILSRLQQSMLQKSPGRSVSPLIKPKDKFSRAQEIVLYMMASSPDFAVQLVPLLNDIAWITHEGTAIFQCFRQQPDLTQPFQLNCIPDHEIKSYLSGILVKESDHRYSMQECLDCIKIIKNYSIQQEIAGIQAQLKTLEQQPGTDTQVEALLNRLRGLYQGTAAT